MQEQPLKHWFSDKRARVYLVWAFLTVVGFTLTHFKQDKQIIGLWLLIAVIGLGTMVFSMPLKERKMKMILASWAIPIGVGLVVSALSFSVDRLASLVQYLGAYWLLVMSVGYFFNGLYDAPAKWYFIAASVNLLGAFIVARENLVDIQYLLTAVISGWSMLMLWVFRSDVQ